MAKAKTESTVFGPKNGRLNHAYDNPYLSPPHVQLDPFRCRMKDIINLYLYMSQPDRTHPTIRRPTHVPFLRRNLYYMQNDVSFSLSKSNVQDRSKHSALSLFELQSDKTDESNEDELPSSFMPPSISFFRMKFEDPKGEYDYADIRCFRARQVDGRFTEAKPVEAAHFHMKLNEEVKIDIDLPNFTPDLPDRTKTRNDYLLLKIEIRSDGIAVSGGRKLRSVPARQAAQSELKHAQNPEHPAAAQPEVQTMFGVCKMTATHQGQQGHTIQEGRTQILLVPSGNLNIDVDTNHWLRDPTLVPNILQQLKRLPNRRSPFIRIETFVDDEDATYSTCASAMTSARGTPAPTTDRRNKTPSSIDAGDFLPSSSASSLISAVGMTQESQTLTCQGSILGIVPPEYRQEMMKSRVPFKLAWCFRMTDETNSPCEQPDSKYAAVSSDLPPADVFRFTGNECVVCSPEYRRPFPTFVSLVFHLSTTHPRLSFEYKKNLIPTISERKNGRRSSTFSPVESQKSDSSLRRRRPGIRREQFEEVEQRSEIKACSGFVIGLNHNYNGAHEFDSSRHYIKRRIPEAWSRPPIFLVVKNIARRMRRYPPSQSLDELEMRGALKDGTFGGCVRWKDPHFHTRKYAQTHAPFMLIAQRRRINDYVDVNDNEKTMLNILSEFHSSFRSLLMPHQAYGANVILVQEQRDLLLKPSIYTQFIIHLSNLKRLGGLYEAEFYDIVARLHHGAGYDPRKDSKHFVYSALQKLEKQRPIHAENPKKGGSGDGKRGYGQFLQNSREHSVSSVSSAASTSNESSESRKPLKIMTRKRSFDNSAITVTREDTKRIKLLTTINEVEVEKKRQFNTNTPMEVLTRNTILTPSQVPVFCFDDLACRYQFASDKNLKLIWRFCRHWTREYLEWQ